MMGDTEVDAIYVATPQSQLFRLRLVGHVHDHAARRPHPDIVRLPAAIAGGLFGPLILYFVKREESEFVRPALTRALGR